MTDPLNSQLKVWKKDMEAFKQRHTAAVKTLVWRDRISQTIVKSLGVICGTAGVAPLVMGLMGTDGQVTFGVPEALALFTGLGSIAQTWIAVQQFGRRIEQHSHTAGECAAFLNKLDSMSMDQNTGEAEMAEDVTALLFMKTQIEKEAPPL